MTKHANWWHDHNIVWNNIMREPGVEPGCPKAPDPKSSTPPTETPKQDERDRTEPHGSAPSRTEHVTNHVTAEPRYGPAVLRALAAALESMLRRYTDLVASGDAGFWDAEAEPVVIEARAALAAYYDDALDAERSRAAVPVLPDESERRPQPHRFGGIL